MGYTKFYNPTTRQTSLVNNAPDVVSQRKKDTAALGEAMKALNNQPKKPNFLDKAVNGIENEARKIKSKVKSGISSFEKAGGWGNPWSLKGTAGGRIK